MVSLVMLKNFFPDEYVPGVFNIDYEKLYSIGIKGIIFDIDGTLVPHGADSTPETDELFEMLHKMGFKTLLLSNNSAERIESFMKNIDSQYISEANKPKTDNYYKAIQMLGLNMKEVVIIGDQLFTDIYGANRCGMSNILVEFLKYDYETKIGKKRIVEKLILILYKHIRRYRYRLGNVGIERNAIRYAEETKKIIL